jgi:hypothetical protein
MGSYGEKMNQKNGKKYHYKKRCITYSWGVLLSKDIFHFTPFEVKIHRTAMRNKKIKIRQI